LKTKKVLPLSDYRKLSDEDVIHRYVHRKEHAAFNCLYERYAHLVLGVCFKYLNNGEAAKDATQQIFIKLLEDLTRFRIENFKPWLLQVVRNHCLMQLRKSVPVVNNTIELGEDMEFEEILHPLAEREQLLSHLETAVQELNPEQRTCIEAFYLKKQNYATIAQETGYTLLQVKSHIQNGKRNLKNKLVTVKAAQR
jgi:RNA polymerase sigma-70 factor (ECF subfamily)